MFSSKIVSFIYSKLFSKISFVCVHQICLKSLTTKEVSRENITVPFLAPITVRGDLIMIRHPITYLICICNWKENTAVAMRFRIAVSYLDLILIKNTNDDLAF